MLAQLKSTTTYNAIASGRSDSMAAIEAAFVKTLAKENIKATVGFTSAFVSVVTESQEDHDKAKHLLQAVPSLSYQSTDFYEADEDMPAEWYARFVY